MQTGNKNNEADTVADICCRADTVADICCRADPVADICCRAATIFVLSPLKLCMS